MLHHSAHPGRSPDLALRLASITILLAGLLLAVQPAAARPQPAAASLATISAADSPFGMNVMGMSRYMTTSPNDDYSTPFNPARAIGVGWTREEMGWHRIEPRPGVWNWGWADKGINAAVSRGIQVVALLDYNVDRSGGGDARISYTMPDLGAWTNYVRQVVSRYKNRVKHWQIWNEPLDDTYFRGKDPVQYARLLAASYDTIKSVDPQAQVLTAGFSPFGLPWMDRMLEAGGRGKFDIVAVHPYVNDPYVPGGSMSPESVYWVNTDLNLVAGWAARNGNKPVWATEFGWNTNSTSPNRVSFEQQANYLTRAYVMGLTSDVDKFMVYQFHDDTTNPNDKYGLLGTDWRSAKPSFNAYRAMTARLEGASPQGRLNPYEGTPAHARLFDFEGAGGGANCPAGSLGDAYWDCWASPFAGGSLAFTSEQARSGKALKATYNLQAGTNDRYVSLITPGFPTLNFNPKKLGFWVYGDGSQTELHLLVKDSAGQTLYYSVGRMGPAALGWQRFEAQLNRPISPKGAFQIHYPIRSAEIVLDGWPKNSGYSGTAYIDDFYAEDSPPVYVYRYTKGGKTLDIAWADGQDATLQLPTRSSQAVVYSRDGQPQTVGADNGRLNLAVGDAPVYIEHEAGQAAQVNSPVSSRECPAAGDGNLRPLFNPTWERYDEAIISGRARRSWMWGPASFRFVQEPYDEAPGGCRTVLYWDKSRMEITNPGGNRADKYFVTNGLLARELVSGRIQVGDNRTVLAPQGAANIPAAGDGANNPNAPTYAAFARVTSLENDKFQPDRGKIVVIDTLDRDGQPGVNGGLAGYNVRLAAYIDITRHNIADVFWQFMYSRGPVKVNGQYQEGDAVDWAYSIGLPLSEPYWARVAVGGVEKDVLIQVFERRVLTYTPSNPDGFRVEMGNIGGHYATWRYGQAAG